MCLVRHTVVIRSFCKALFYLFLFDVLTDTASLVAGPKAVLLLGAQPAVHATVRSMYDEALSAKAVLEITPFAEARLRQHTLRWEAIAQSGEARSGSSMFLPRACVCVCLRQCMPFSQHICF